MKTKPQPLRKGSPLLARGRSNQSDELTVEERSQLLSVARRFYLEDQSKIQIAAELQISRFKVARMLDLARAQGLVTITLNDDGAVDWDLSQQLAQHLGLAEVVVVHANGDTEQVRKRVAAAGAEFVSSTLRDGEVLGMAWGRTLSALTAALPRLPRMSIVQLTGAAGSDVGQSPVELVRLIAQNSGGSAHPIFAPLVVETAETARSLRQQPDIARAFAMFADVTTALVSVGSWNPPDSQLYEFLPPGEREALVARGVVAEVSATLLAADGVEIADDFVDRTIAVSTAQLRAIPRVLAVAAGARKAGAVAAVTRAGLITGLVTDHALAIEALAAASPRSGDAA
ncbi:sugar-binding transcriptional regulator [Microbacterium invictum]|uniref:DNA-binding transcriptional regulator LsrR (DeoR family) n=1 Tax=Microbacterium invictum TaxID=515415 RepID=A0AA40SQT1_9MICO|nr:MULTISPECIES: sugar-binding domain-containing protein [Microbacterium]MBB4140678.1 DNA-binding transcriptional regulator LsrR (DeoR family) [Microbacterium invictum]